MLRNLSASSDHRSNSFSHCSQRPAVSENTLLALSCAQYLVRSGPTDGWPAFCLRTHAIVIFTARCFRQFRPVQTETPLGEDGIRSRLVAPDRAGRTPIGAVYIRSDLQELRGRLQRYAIIAAIVLSVMSLAATDSHRSFCRAVAEPSRVQFEAKLQRLFLEHKNYSVRATSIRTLPSWYPYRCLHENVDADQPSEKALRKPMMSWSSAFRNDTAEP